MKSLEGHKLVKRLSDTRWSARADAVNALAVGYDKICEALESIVTDERQTMESRNEARNLKKTMTKLETVLILLFWNDILTRFNEVSKNLQKIDISLSTVIRLFTSLKGYVNDLRDQFGKYETIAKSKVHEGDYFDNVTRPKERSSRLSFFEGKSKDIIHRGADKFRIETFIPIIDAIITELNKREQAYHDIDNKFSYFAQLQTLSNDEIIARSKTLAAMYYLHLEEENLISECLQFKHYQQTYTTTLTESAASIYLHLKENHLESTFPNMEICLRIYCSMMASNASAERTFSKMKLIKNELRSTMSETRLNSLSIMSIESDILQGLDFSDIVSSFATIKSRKRSA